MMLLQSSWLLLCLVFVLNSFLTIPLCHCQINFPQNIETFYPNEPQAPEQAPGPISASKTSSSKAKIAIAVATSAASAVVVGVILFILYQRCLKKRRKNSNLIVVEGNLFERINGNVKGVIVDEDGLDVIYWRKLEGKNSISDLQKEVFHSPKNKEKVDEENDEEENQVKKFKSIQQVPLHRGKSSTSHTRIPHNASTFLASVEAVIKQDSPIQPFNATLQSSPSTASTLPPITATKNPSPPPLPPKEGGCLNSSSKPLPKLVKQRNSSGKGNMPETSNDQVKLKPLHWDKVNTNNADHSMVWDKVDGGSFSVDQDLMEALFGYVATNRKSPKGKNDSTIPSKAGVATPTRIFLLDPRKSQNIAIVLKSLGATQDEILEALIDGRGLNADTIEMLARVFSPTQEEQSLILEYKGDPTRLATAESFLYHILKALPSAFKRVNAMLFRLNYDSEILDIRESLQTLELGCKELKSQRLFVRLLEAVLKTGNRINAGTARGNAHAFNLDSLRKLSDVKSTNGETTLLNFVVEGVIRLEGKHIAFNRSLSRSSSRNNNSNVNASSKNNAAPSNEDKEREYTMLGLPIVGGISSEFCNLKKAALIDYDSLVGSISALSTRIIEIQKLVSQCGNEGGNFVKEFNHLLRGATEELKLVRDEQTRVMQLIKRTAEYYQGGASQQNFQLFVIVKDFLGMVDQACIEIARNLQKKKTHKASSG
ncbi:putative formin, FH2 domain-containing protein [Lupinus albus]|uniref:Formin-like protein n=1 Tax=Lupinus albus TaxID=3870 RepID=A0A6A4QM19_LUPAL|nr:putative formin, FH2 domain-containing protein [Lupinus albus]